MLERTLAFFKHRFIDDRFLFLLISILSLIIIYPIMRNFVRMGALIDVFSTVILVSGIYAAARTNLSYRIAIFLAIPMLVATWWSAAVASIPLILAKEFFSFLFVGFTLVTIFRYIVQTQKITADVIYGSVVVYLLIGVLWSNIYAFLEAVHPGSFGLSQLGAELTADDRYILVYYSFVTLTTLGYGDVLPASAVAASFAVVEAVIGQIYIAVTIARIVGIHVAQSTVNDGSH